MNKFDNILPTLFLNLFNDNIIFGVIQFGSSLNKNNPQDIDLAVIVCKGKFDEFIKNLDNYKSIESVYDISLILEEEIQDVAKFNFGGHGSYLIESFRCGKALIGKNPFLDFPRIDESQIKSDIFERMKEYIYVLRKSYFHSSFLSKFESRYLKCLKLSYFLLNNNEKFPEILSISEEDCLFRLKEMGYTLGIDKRANIELLWKQIKEQYS